MKKCSCCGLQKDESEFFKKRVSSLEGFCKSCKKEKLKKRKEQDPDKYREKERLRSEQRRQTQEFKEWRKDHQERNRDKISRKSREYYEDKKKSVYEVQKIWKSKNKEKVREYNSEFKKKNPLKVACHKFVCAALKEGIINKALVCCECQIECKAEAHHEDYTKPLDVIWLCHRCHMKRHRKHK